MFDDDRGKNLGPNARAVRKEVVVTAPLAEVWRSWTTSEGIKAFVGVNSRIELDIAGSYEMYFAADANSPSWTLITSIVPSVSPPRCHSGASSAKYIS